ncbi:hypothetical protein EVG20_g7163 [Dentipellis fragilis]|uniref:Uncharacterized protein n=1 Tax=Dentipellis fragilis TaxID=205917 RepID=A0A4Y9YGM5_9AGAM|nr:hypothetical protein EVG20_g7163 [Dentipellis fragilis]
MVLELSKDQRLLLRRGARIQAAFDTWKAVGSPSTAAWLDNFIAEHVRHLLTICIRHMSIRQQQRDSPLPRSLQDAMCDEFNRVKDAGEDIVLHPVGWSLHYRRARASMLGRGDEYWAARISPRDPALEHLLANEAVPVPEGAGDLEDDSDYEDLGPGVPRESKWWMFKDSELTRTTPNGNTDGARSSASLEIAVDRYSDTAPAAPTLSPAARAVPATHRDHCDSPASAQAVEETSADSRSTRTFSRTPAAHGDDSSLVPARGYNGEPSGGLRDKDQDHHPDIGAGQTKVRQLLDRILRGRRQSESGTPEAVVHGRATARRSVTPGRMIRQRTPADSSPTRRAIGKRVSFRLPSPPRAFDSTSAVPQKRKHSGFGDSVDTHSMNTSNHRSGSADVGSEGASSPSFAKRRRVLGYGQTVENVDEAEESDEPDEAEADGEGDSGNAHRMLTRRAVAKLTSTPPSREKTPVEPQVEKPVPRARTRRILRPLTASELEFMAHASNVKVNRVALSIAALEILLNDGAQVVSCQKCIDDGIKCVPTSVGHSCKGCRNRKKCTHVAAGNRGGPLRLTPSHFWESLLRNAARPIPPLPPVPYLFPLDEVDKLGVDHSTLISKLRYPKNIAEAEQFLDVDEFSGLAAGASGSQPTPMDVDSSRPIKKLPRRGQRASASVTATPSRSALTSNSGETSRALAVLQDEVRNLQLQVSEQQEITASYGQRLDTHHLHIDHIRGKIPEIAQGVANVAQSHRRMEKETDRMAESHRRIEKEVADSWEIMQGTAAAMQSLLDRFAMMSSTG